MEKTIINRTAWHFRWLKHLGLIKEYYDWGDKLQLSGPKSICAYFWKLAFTTWIPLLTAGFFVFMNVKYIAIPQWEAVGLAYVIALALIGLIGMTVLFGSMYGLKKLLFTRDIYYRTVPKGFVKRPVTTLGLGLEFIKAKKNRVCPLIDYKE